VGRIKLEHVHVLGAYHISLNLGYVVLAYTGADIDRLKVQVLMQKRGWTLKERNLNIEALKLVLSKLQFTQSVFDLRAYSMHSSAVFKLVRFTFNNFVEGLTH